MTSRLAAHPEIPSLMKPFRPGFCWTPRKVISPLLLGQGRLIHHQPSMILHFVVFFFILLNWAAAVLCILCWMCVRDCQYECLVYIYCQCFFLLVSVPFCFCQFASITLSFINCLYPIGGWLTIFLKRKGMCLMWCVTLEAGNCGTSAHIFHVSQKVSRHSNPRPCAHSVKKC